MNKNICLIGNPNCGKTTLFNCLTGTYQKVGNWAGVTTEKKEGKYKKDKSIKIIDLPGLYSLDTISSDELVVIDYLKKNTPDIIINVIDGTNLERNLYLTCQLTKLNIPMIIAVNFSDQLKKDNVTLDLKYIEQIFGVPAIEISAKKKKNVDLLIKISCQSKRKPTNIISDYVNFAQVNVNKIMKKTTLKGQKISQKIDNVVLNKYLSLPLFCVIILLIYLVSIKFGGIISKYIENVFDYFILNTKSSLQIVGAPRWTISLVCNAILGGLSSVLGFLPQILILFCLLTILEESGYSARLSFVLDNLFSKFGLSGKSSIPLMVSCGCIVPGLMATKAIEDDVEKFSTIVLSTFMPCGAKMAVFGWFSYKFFNGNPLIATSLYFLSVFVALIVGLLIKKISKTPSEDSLFLLEIPPYRLPQLKNILLVLWDKCRDFLVKGGTIIFGVSVIVWLLQNFGFKGYVDANIQESFLFLIGNAIKFIFVPLGFGSWQASVSFLSGIFAKEAVVECLQIITSDINLVFDNKFSVYSFLTFVLLSPPCMASIITAKNQLKNNKKFFIMLLIEIITAYIVSFVINMIGKVVYGDIHLIYLIIAVIMIVANIFLIYLLIKRVAKKKEINRKHERKQNHLRLNERRRQV